MTPDPLRTSADALARHGFDEPEASAAALVQLGAWPPSAALGGHRLLAELAGSAHPDLAARALAAIAAARPDPDAFAAALRRRPGFRRRLVAVVAASRSMGAWLAAHPEEADRLVHGQACMEPRSRGDRGGSWSRRRWRRWRGMTTRCGRGMRCAGSSGGSWCGSRCGT